MQIKNRLFKLLAATSLIVLAAIGSAQAAKGTLSSLTIDTDYITGGGIAVRTLTVVLNRTGSGTQVINITTGAGITPSSTSISLTGSTTVGTFTITAPAVQAADATVNVSVQLPTGGTTLTQPVLLKKMHVKAPFWGNKVLVQGVSYNAVVELNGPTAVNRTIIIDNTNPDIAVPTSVIIPAGQRSASFTVSVGATATGNDSISATFNGDTLTRYQEVRALAVSSMTLGAATVVGGNSFSVTVVLNTDVSADSLVDISTIKDGVVTVLAQQTVLAGSNSVTFNISTTSTVDPYELRVISQVGVTPRRLKIITVLP